MALYLNNDINHALRHDSGFCHNPIQHHPVDSSLKEARDKEGGAPPDREAQREDTTRMSNDA